MIVELLYRWVEEKTSEESIAHWIHQNGHFDGSADEARKLARDIKRIAFNSIKRLANNAGEDFVSRDE